MLVETILRKGCDEVPTASKYHGSSNLGRLIQEYLEKREMTQVSLGKRIGRSQPSISHLMRGAESAGKDRPYFGLKGRTSNDESLLHLVMRELKIPMSKVREALAEDLLAYSVHRMSAGLAPNAKRKPGSSRQNTWSVLSRSGLGLRGRRSANQSTDHNKARSPSGAYV